MVALDILFWRKLKMELELLVLGVGFYLERGEKLAED
jgi:hypothetical protein